MNEQALLELAIEAAAAGAAILEANARHLTGRRVVPSEKGSAIDLVTDVDRASEDAVLAVLRRAEIPIVAEESGGERRREGAVWYVDPLDGTTNYAHGHPFFCVSIGLVVDDLPRLGVVHAPMLGVVFQGGVALGGLRRDLFHGVERPLVVSATSSLERSLLATGFPYDRMSTGDDNLAAHGALLKRVRGVSRCGSAALDCALVADGTYDGYWERKLAPWDLAAGSALVIAAGGRVSDPWGRPLRVLDGTILATNGVLHETLCATLRPHLPEESPR